MTARDYLAHPEFVAFCRYWQEATCCPLPFADWLIERDLPGHGAGAWYAARSGWKIVRQEAGYLHTPTLPPTAVWAKCRHMHLPSFEAAVIDLLDAWAVAGLTLEQYEVARSLLADKDSKQLQTCGGFAGTGKTQLLSHLSAELPGWATVAYTGKAADGLRRRGLDGATIHGTIYKAVREGNRVRFELKRRHEVYWPGFLIDEASMVSAPILKDLLSFGKPVIAVGDHGQLPPVGDDAGLMREPDYRLETVHRNAGPIARFAEYLRTGGEARDWKGYRTEATLGKVWVGPSRDVPDSTLLAADQIICAFNKTRVAVNRKVRAGRFRERGVPGHLFRSEQPQHGDRVIAMMTNTAAGIFNGQQGRFSEINGETATYHPENGDPVELVFNPDSFHSVKGLTEEMRADRRQPFDYAYCITCHKMQGDEAAKVVVLEERCDLWEHSRWAYTAASRAKESLVWVTG
jgi:exodeoxyribonuclease V